MHTWAYLCVQKGKAGCSGTAAEQTCKELWKLHWQDDCFLQGVLGALQSSNIIPLRNSRNTAFEQLPIISQLCRL